MKPEEIKKAAGIFFQKHLALLIANKFIEERKISLQFSP